MRRVSVLVASVAMIATLTGGLPTAAAAKAAPADHAAGNSKSTVTSGTHGENAIPLPRRTSTASVATPAPYTSPAAAQRYFQWHEEFWCESGYVCASVPHGGGYYVFKFLQYGTYRLSYWYCCGLFHNSQTGDAAAKLLDINGRQLYCLNPYPGDIWVDWNPVWYIKLTSNPC